MSFFLMPSHWGLTNEFGGGDINIDGEVNGNLHQGSCLGNPMTEELRATVHTVAELGTIEWMSAQTLSS